ncbi:PucR family transcriptional regulator [Lihuaxuella thermophila]|uniref:PucR C-terminal helix-turn-helix domain-containing protein n=1 Tax=Lihuaxuella thermophila TaxID=1173111 RepID=A0A1H8GTP6_9BACL|nr:helix-turn-helix domain-containing protein [Lihuaxuella thermophila]SEN47501.1 PucR C-terminal helix-turn-helix domain-containing protein [Lihuaxuella thermophila]
MKLNQAEAKMISELEKALNTKILFHSPSSAVQQVFVLPFTKQRFTFATPLNPREQALVQLFLNTWREEKTTLVSWLKAVRENEAAVLPPELSGLDWNKRVPFLVIFETELDETAGEEAEALLEGYFDRQQAWLAAINHQEWLILAPQAGLSGEDDESWETLDSLLQAAEGLAEAIQNEIGKKAMILVHRPISSPEEIRSMWFHLLNSYQLAKTFHPGRTVHAAWNLGLEQLLENLDEEAAERFLSRFPSPEMFQDEEMRKTMEMFFRLNLNVSETARQLFIHRNTLLYRLERLKQETGLDLRQFEDAVLAKIALLLTMILDAD